MNKKIRNFILFPLMILSIFFVAIFGYRLFRESQYISTLMIDPGHGGYDVGAIGSDGTYEKDLTLAIALRTGAVLKEINPDIKVVYTRSDDTIDWANNEVDDLAGRVQKSINQKADYYLSIHLNASDNTEAYGYNAFIRSNDSISKNIADNIEDNLTKAGWNYNRGIEYTDTNPLYVVDNQSIPAMLFEVGFITNPSECSDLKKSYNQETIARAIAKSYNDFIIANTKTD